MLIMKFYFELLNSLETAATYPVVHWHNSVSSINWIQKMLKSISARQARTHGQNQNASPVLLKHYFAGSTHLTPTLDYTLTMYLDPATSLLYSSSLLVPQLLYPVTSFSHSTTNFQNTCKQIAIIYAWYSCSSNLRKIFLKNSIKSPKQSK